MAGQKSAILIQHSLKVETEICAIVDRIVDNLVSEDLLVREQYAKLNSIPEDTLDKLAGIAEVKIKLKLIQKIKRETLKILRSSTNRMILASIKIDDN